MTIFWSYIFKTFLCFSLPFTSPNGDVSQPLFLRFLFGWLLCCWYLDGYIMYPHTHILRRLGYIVCIIKIRSTHFILLFLVRLRMFKLVLLCTFCTLCARCAPCATLQLFVHYSLASAREFLL